MDDLTVIIGDPKTLIKLCIDNPNWFSIGFARDCMNFLEFIEQLIHSVWEATKEGTDVIVQNPVTWAGTHVAEKFKVTIVTINLNLTINNRFLLLLHLQCHGTELPKSHTYETPPKHSLLTFFLAIRLATRIHGTAIQLQFLLGY